MGTLQDVRVQQLSPVAAAYCGPALGCPAGVPTRATFCRSAGPAGSGDACAIAVGTAQAESTQRRQHHHRHHNPPRNSSVKTLKVMQDMEGTNHTLDEDVAFDAADYWSAIGASTVCLPLGAC